MNKYFVTFLVALLLPAVSHAEEKRWISAGRFLIGGTQVNPKLDGKDIPEDFFGTVAELIMSAEVLKGAVARVHALHPDLPPEQINIKAGRLPKTRIIVVAGSGQDPAHTQACTDAVMDEFIAKWKELKKEERKNDIGEGARIAIQDMLVRLEIDIQHEEQNIKAEEIKGAKPEQLIESNARVQRNKMSHERLMITLKHLPESPRNDASSIAVIERATRPVLVVPNKSLLDFLKK